MRWILGASLAAMVCTNANGRSLPQKLEPGIYTNEEEVYFDDLAKRPAAPWISLKISVGNDGEVLMPIDAFSKPTKDTEALFRTLRDVSKSADDRIKLFLSDGTVTELRRARPVSCWVSIRKEEPKEDGSEDWYFQSGVKLHDQGGRAIVGGGDTGVQPVVIRVRNVTWDSGSTNAPVVSLYIHKPDNIDHAESYSWAAPDSARVGINLRWVQAGCAIEGLGTPSKLNNDTFKSNEEAKAQ
jgi:hypothetical protein